MPKSPSASPASEHSDRDSDSDNHRRPSCDTSTPASAHGPSPGSRLIHSADESVDARSTREQYLQHPLQHPLLQPHPQSHQQQPQQHLHHPRRTKNDSAMLDLMDTTHDWTAAAARQNRSDLAGSLNPLSKDNTPDATTTNTRHFNRYSTWRNPWACSALTGIVTILGSLLLFGIVQSFFTRHVDPKGCQVCQMRPGYAKLAGFDTEHTRFASKYSLHLYREGVIDDDTRLKGVPVVFIPGNAGSYKQVRSYAAEAANYWHDHIRDNEQALNNGMRALDFFAVDFNEDITAFHGQTLLDQAEYLNDAIAYVLSLYHNPHLSIRDPSLPDPSSVIVLGHSMGGVVARTTLIMPNYVENSINTIVTLAAPHVRPPVSFDRDIVRAYDRVNAHWRQAYSQTSPSNNSLWGVTTISIAGGGLDTMVPSDYASLASIVPESHGFTVFTSTIPEVWTGMDHLAITWCDQLRKAVVRALYNVVDVSSSAQTKPHAERMRAFKKWLLTGLEQSAEKTLPLKEPKILLTLDDHSHAYSSLGERLVLQSLGQHKRTKAYLLPVPPQDSLDGKKFTLLTDQKLDASGDHGSLEVLVCSVYPLQTEKVPLAFSWNIDLSGDGTAVTRLACKNAASDVISLPASTQHNRYAFDAGQLFSYLQYDLEALTEQQFVVIIDKMTEPVWGWVIAEFSAASESTISTDIGLKRLLTDGLKVTLPAKRPMVTELQIPALHSSLLAYKLSIQNQQCPSHQERFKLLLRQYTDEVYESKYFVNVENAEINLHGVAPYIPSSHLTTTKNGLGLQLWIDPTCDASIEIALEVDLLASLGKLWMRYRMVFATLPLVIVTMVFRKQFRMYNQVGIFMSFSESINQCLVTSLPVLFLALTLFGLSLASQSHPPSPSTQWLSSPWPLNTTVALNAFMPNDLLLGSRDIFFWFLIPVFGIICVSICVIINYFALVLVHVLTMIYTFVRFIIYRRPENRRAPPTFAVSSIRQRLITTAILLVLVSTAIPYHFAYVVLCIVQIATCVRAYRLARDTKSETAYNFSNYCHSVLVLMLWILPINLPVLVVWIRNLAMHWLTPFSTHHNILSIMPFFLLVETLSTGRMIPRVVTRFRHVTSSLLFIFALYAGVYGVTYAYRLHNLTNTLCAWLTLVHLSDTSFSLSGLDSHSPIEEEEKDAAESAARSAEAAKREKASDAATTEREREKTRQRNRDADSSNGSSSSSGRAGSSNRRRGPGGDRGPIIEDAVEVEEDKRRKKGGGVTANTGRSKKQP